MASLIVTVSFVNGCDSQVGGDVLGIESNGLVVERCGVRVPVVPLQVARQTGEDIACQK